MSPANRAYVCLSCLLKSGRHSFSTNLSTAGNSNPTPKSPSPQSIIFNATIQPLPHHLQSNLPDASEDTKTAVSAPEERQSQDVAKSDYPVRKVAGLVGGGLMLVPSETGRLRRLEGLLKKVSASATTANPSTNLPVGEAVKQSLGTLYLEERAILMRLVKAYGDRDLTGFSSEIHRISQIGSKKPLKEETLQKLVKDIRGAEYFGINLSYNAELASKVNSILKPVENDQEKRADAPELSGKGRRRRIRTVLSTPTGVQGRGAAINSGLKSESVKSRRLSPRAHSEREVKAVALKRARARITAQKESANGTIAGVRKKFKESAVAADPFSKLEPDQLQTIKAPDLFISPVEENVLPVPGLSHDLSRVLFNPGIYQLQDPRSRVFNFDPYLQNIMPVAEFDFNALKDYITSSKDDTLSQIASQRGRKYVGSSSSMTGMLVHFHFLLSHWREINTSTLSRGFPEKLTSFTAIQRAPSAIFLRWKDGHYAIDADKEYDSANILMSLGRSLEKLFTLEKDEFERYRKSNQAEFSEEERSIPESYHYSEMGKFLMRSQLDAHDPRLPGTGMFDLKTRAVVSIRMNTSRHEEGLGYQIRQRFGGWESYEREFFDMIRSAFLKYSLQVRMGRMDGIFVAFHNVEQIFGFQYVSLPELDLHLHGQSDTTLGDQEFKISLAMLEEVFDRATKKFPEQSLRFHFETRNTMMPFMYIFAEPVDEEDIRAIQDSKKNEIAEIEKRILGMAGTQTARSESDEDTVPELSLPSSNSSSTETNVAFFDSIGKSLEESMQSPNSSSTETNVTFFDSVGKSLEESMQSPNSSPTDGSSPSSASEPPSEAKEVLGMVLTIRNKVNRKVVLRPTHLKPSDEWKVEYTLTEMDRPGRAWSMYSACRNRRKMELSRPDVEKDTAANYYLKKIKEITQQGAKWRREQDELNKGREAVVLYGTGRGTEVQ
jgi:hypothetical protein